MQLPEHLTIKEGYARFCPEGPMKARGMLIIAIVAPPALIDARKFGVTAAHNMGLRGDVFTTRASALESYRTARRRLLSAFALACATPGAFAEELLRTPRQTEGPFYPDHLPLDTDNDLLRINDAVTPAIGEVTQLSGRILDVDGRPVRSAVVEIWQADHNGVYLHPGSAGGARRDANFQGFGRFETASTGEYRFRTIKPVPYANRTPHIHFAVRRGAETFTTQCYVAGEPLNERDGVLNGIRDPKARASVIVPFVRVPDSPTGELAARFDIVLSRAAA